jgi:hypothetical protein
MSRVNRTFLQGPTREALEWQEFMEENKEEKEDVEEQRSN